MTIFLCRIIFGVESTLYYSTGDRNTKFAVDILSFFFMFSECFFFKNQPKFNTLKTCKTPNNCEISCNFVVLICIFAKPLVFSAKIAILSRSKTPRILSIKMHIFARVLLVCGEGTPNNI